jgi:hypothetical protein
MLRPLIGKDDNQRGLHVTAVCHLQRPRPMLGEYRLACGLGQEKITIVTPAGLEIPSRLLATTDEGVE